MSEKIPESVLTHQLLARWVHVTESYLLELVQLVRVPVDGRTKVTFKDCPYPYSALAHKFFSAM